MSVTCGLLLAGCAFLLILALFVLIDGDRDIAMVINRGIEKSSLLRFVQNDK